MKYTTCLPLKSVVQSEPVIFVRNKESQLAYNDHGHLLYIIIYDLSIEPNFLKKTKKTWFFNGGVFSTGLVLSKCGDNIQKRIKG